MSRRLFTHLKKRRTGPRVDLRLGQNRAFFFLLSFRLHSFVFFLRLLSFAILFFFLAVNFPTFLRLSRVYPLGGRRTFAVFLRTRRCFLPPREKKKGIMSHSTPHGVERELQEIKKNGAPETATNKQRKTRYGKHHLPFFTFSSIGRWLSKQTLRVFLFFSTLPLSLPLSLVFRCFLCLFQDFANLKNKSRT